MAFVGRVGGDVAVLAIHADRPGACRRFEAGSEMCSSPAARPACRCDLPALPTLIAPQPGLGTRARPRAARPSVPSPRRRRSSPPPACRPGGRRRRACRAATVAPRPCPRPGGSSASRCAKPRPSPQRLAPLLGREPDATARKTASASGGHGGSAATSDRKYPTSNGRPAPTSASTLPASGPVSRRSRHAKATNRSSPRPSKTRSSPPRGTCRSGRRTGAGRPAPDCPRTGRRSATTGRGRRRRAACGHEAVEPVETPGDGEAGSADGRRPRLAGRLDGGVRHRVVCPVPSGRAGRRPCSLPRATGRGRPGTCPRRPRGRTGCPAPTRSRR